MDNLSGRISEWRKAGLVSAKQAKDIAAYERDRGSRTARPAAEPSDRTAPVVEALGYVGAAIALAALGILLGDRWDDLNVGGRLAVVGALIVILASAALALRRNPHSPIQRLVSVLAVGSLGGVAWLLGIVLVEWTDWRSRDVALAIAGAVFVLAVPLYLLRRRALPQMAVLVSTLVLVGTLFARPAFSGEVSWVGIATWAVAVAWVTLALGGWLEPAEVAIATGSVAAIVGAIAAATGDGRAGLLGLGIATAAVLIWRGVVTDMTLMVGIGAIGTLIFVPQIILEVFPEGMGAVVAMLVVGLLIVLFAVWVARGRRDRTTTPAKGGRR